MQVKFKAKEKGEQPKLFTQLPHRYKYFTKHPLEKHPKEYFFFRMSRPRHDTELIFQCKFDFSFVKNALFFCKYPESIRKHIRRIAKFVHA